MKFGDVVTAVASAAVIMVLINVSLGLVLIPALGFQWGQDVTAIVSFFLAALITGYIFAGKIWEESRIEAIAKITVLGAVLVMFDIVLSAAVFADWTQMIKDAYLEANPGAILSKLEWWVVVGRMTSYVVVLNVVLVLVLGFVGLYVGSMIRRPVKSRE